MHIQHTTLNKYTLYTIHNSQTTHNPHTTYNIYTRYNKSNTINHTQHTRIHFTEHRHKILKPRTTYKAHHI